MRARRPFIWLALAAFVGLARPASAEQTIVLPGGVDLQAAIDRSADGDTLVLQGEHHGPIRITRKLTLEGELGAVLLGTGEGSVITVIAPGVVVRGLTIRGSGRNLERMDAGVFVEQSAAGAIIEDNRIEGNLYGVYLHGAENAVARKNDIIGIEVGRVNEAQPAAFPWWTSSRSGAAREKRGTRSLAGRHRPTTRPAAGRRATT